MAKHLSEDEVTLVVNAKADKAQQNIRKFSKEIDNLGERNKSLQRQMESLELAGKKNTDSWKQRREEYGRNATQIRNLKQQIAAETKALDLNALTMAQLRQQARSLQRQLDNTSKTINPDDWKKLSSRLSDVRERMGELSNASKSLVEKYSNPQTMSFFRGELFVRFGELVGKALQKVKEFAAEGISMAESVDGVIHAFRKLNQPGLLDNLRKATKGTVTDIELMKAAVKNLKIAKAKEAFDYYSNLTSGAMQALMQAEEANVDAKYDAEIEAAKNAGKDTTELEKKKANEKLKIQKKYADVNFAIQASQIIASTAAAIAKTFSELGFPAGIPAAVLMSVTGTAQLAAALAERNKVKKMTMQGASSSTSSGARVATGLEAGGSIDIEREQDGKRFHAAYEPNRRGFVDKPTVIVGEGGYGHSKEWVASNAAVENPTVAPFIDIIDRAQRAGTIRTLDMNKFLVQQAQGRASGGYVTPTVNDVRGVVKDSYKDTLIERLTDVLDRLSADGIPASVSLNEIEQKQQLQDKARRFGSK